MRIVAEFWPAVDLAENHYRNSPLLVRSLRSDVNHNLEELVLTYLRNLCTAVACWGCLYP